MVHEVKSKYALITGATSGIGYELAKLFAKGGYNLVIAARNETELITKASELQMEFEIEVVTLSKDLFDPENAFDLYNEIILKGIQIDVLVNNAGQGYFGEFIKTDIHRELDIIQLNVSSLVILTKLFLQDMVERGEGKILNVSSVGGRFPGPFQSVYHSTKAFVESFTEATRNEVKDKGVVITSLLPGATDTDFFNKADMENSNYVQVGILADPAEVANDGYQALMNNDDIVISGLKNKMQVAMNSITFMDRVCKER